MERLIDEDSGTAKEEYFPVLWFGDEVPASEAMICRACGVKVSNLDFHADWHQNLTKKFDDISERIEDIVELFRRFSD